MYNEVLKEVIKNGRVSTSYLQRKFVIGYAKAAQLIDMLEEKKVISHGNGSKPREVLIKSE
jgi:S-DNA-T family DNA segregation ATPase FtsK/SpoIIIE